MTTVTDPSPFEGRERRRERERKKERDRKIERER